MEYGSGFERVGDEPLISRSRVMWEGQRSCRKLGLGLKKYIGPLN